MISGIKTEKEKRIIALIKEGKSSREIAKIEHVSFTPIANLKEELKKEEKTLAEERNRILLERASSAKYARVLELLSEGKDFLEIAIITGLRAEELIPITEGYWDLVNLSEFYTLYSKKKPYLDSILELDLMMKKEGMTREDVKWTLKRGRDVKILVKEILQHNHHLEWLDDEIKDNEDYLDSLNQKKDFLEDRIEKLELEYIDKRLDRSYTCS